MKKLFISLVNRFRRFTVDSSENGPQAPDPSLPPTEKDALGSRSNNPFRAIIAPNASSRHSGVVTPPAIQKLNEATSTNPSVLNFITREQLHRELHQLRRLIESRK